MDSARRLLHGLIDYAGLFPPASSSMPDAVRAYDHYGKGPDKEFLGRFILPLARLDEFNAEAREYLGRGADSVPWRLSLIAALGDLKAASDSALHFNCSHWKESEIGHAVCDAMEIAVATAADVNQVLAELPEFFQVFLEVPLTGDIEPLIEAIAGTRAAAKMRSGGITSQAFPDSGQVARFIRACKVHGVPFKATAGLHHAIRSSYPLTYEPDSAAGEMFGYLNVFLAAAFVDAGFDDDVIIDILEERDASTFRFSASGVSWHGTLITAEQLARTRERFALSYGSCSFTEPVTEARALGLI